MKIHVRSLFTNLRTRMTLAFSILLVVLIIGLVTIGYFYILNVGEQSAAVYQDQLMERTLSLIDAYFDEMDQMAQQIAGDYRIINLFNSLQESDEENYFERDIMQSIDVASILTTFSQSQSRFWRIHLYNGNSDHISVGAALEPGSQVHTLLADGGDAERLMAELLADENHVKLSTPENDRWTELFDTRVFSLYRPISNSYYFEVYGIVEVQQEVQTLEDLLAFDTQEIGVFVFDQTGEQVLPANVEFSQFDRQSSYITTAEFDRYGWTVSLVQSRSQMIEPFRSFLWYLILVGVALVVFLLAAIYLIAGQISKPVVKLSKNIQQITFNNLEAAAIDTGGESVAEVRQLQESFSAMLRRLNDSLAYEKKSYLLALQSQMDPHFLYNALSVINALSLAGRNDDVSEACDKLGAMLRYSSSFDVQGTVLQDEIEHVTRYMELMKLRFQDQLDYRIYMDPGLGGMPMPRQVLQPLAENCFGHGFKDALPPWYVSIFATREGDEWCIRVEDNGKGISEGDIAAIRDKVEAYMESIPENYTEMKIGGLGLANTIMRLKLASTSEVTWSIRSGPRGGTTVELRGVLYDANLSR